MSGTLTAILIGFYMVLAIVTACEKRWPVCLYWIGAAIVTGSVLWMSTRGTMEIPK